MLTKTDVPRYLVLKNGGQKMDVFPDRRAAGNCTILRSNRIQRRVYQQARGFAELVSLYERYAARTFIAVRPRSNDSIADFKRLLIPESTKCLNLRNNTHPPLIPDLETTACPRRKGAEIREAVKS